VCHERKPAEALGHTRVTWLGITRDTGEAAWDLLDEESVFVDPERESCMSTMNISLTPQLEKLVQEREIRSVDFSQQNDSRDAEAHERGGSFARGEGGAVASGFTRGGCDIIAIF
jgi:hypothetical protein